MEIAATCSISYLSLQAGSFTLERIGLGSTISVSVVLALVGLAIFLPVFLREFAQTGRSSKLWRRLIGILGLTAAVACSALWGPEGDSASQIVLLLGMALGVLLAFPALRHEPKRALIVFAWWMLVVGVVFAAAGLAFSGGRAAILGGGPNTYARMVGASVIAAIYLAQIGRSRLLLLLVPLQIAALVASGSRGGVLGLFCGLAVFFVATLGRRMVPWTRIAMGAVAIALIGSAASSGLAQRIQSTWETRFVRLTFEQQYLSGRENLWREALEYLGQNPIIGGGFDGFVNYIGFYSYPHNLFLDVGVRLGWVGIVGLVLLLVAMIGRPRVRALGADAVFPLSLAALFFAASMFSGWFFDSRFMWLALLMYLANAARPDSDQLQTTIAEAS